ncbi:antibiotic biosynthesis monooxygenase family protein [Roseateles violae]|uniref:Antibiotic biosynthesis monooxygenase n=1 Tax=Roseateles violae TaxID=3058042 RepID=A0ABT8DX07_9BURK|nr:antibiotic biosynthesis monooxygenase [Pelomonas sp. PFR6]MDN3921720.1 antibiotic biosynthesis monooxygenase [Pelomonas sp. PFR6]
MSDASASKLVVIFRSRLRQDADLAALEPLGMRMYELASAMPGFLSYKDFAAADGENLSLVEFADADSLRAWRLHPEHVAVQERARLEFMAEYQIDVCRPERSYAFKAGA